MELCPLQSAHRDKLLPRFSNGQETSLKAVHMVHPNSRIPLCQNQQALFMAALTDDALKVTCKSCLRTLNAKETLNVRPLAR
jgi:hypothetical protein